VAAYSIIALRRRAVPQRSAAHPVWTNLRWNVFHFIRFTLLFKTLNFTNANEVTVSLKLVSAFEHMKPATAQWVEKCFHARHILPNKLRNKLLNLLGNICPAWKNLNAPGICQLVERKVNSSPTMEVEAVKLLSRYMCKLCISLSRRGSGSLYSKDDLLVVSCKEGL